jgi:flagellar hook-associated protein 3 FlgL
MRITQNTIANNAIYNFQQGRLKLDTLQESLSTQQKVNRPSDNPISSGVLMDIGDQLKALDQYTTSINKANTWVKFTDNALTGMTNILTTAKKIVSSIGSGNSDPTSRQSAHDLLIDLKKQLVELGNSQMGDQYVFGGAINNTSPFNNTDNLYAGDSTMLTIDIAKGSSQPISLTGDRVLLGKSTPAGTLPDYGGTDILTTFDNLITAVGDTATPTDVTALTAGTVDLQAGFTQVTHAIGDNTSRINRIDNITRLNENNRNLLQSMVGDLQNVDLAQLGVEIQSQTTAFEASLSATAKVSQLSLLNYL